MLRKLKTCDMKWYPCVLTACQLVLCDLEGEERTAENMDVSDGLLLQVNNGEQWCNRWKHPSDDSVSNRSTVCLHMPSYCRIFITPFVRSQVFLSCLSMHIFHKTGGFMCVITLPSMIFVCFKDRSTSPSVLRCVASTWKEGLLNRKRPFVGRCCHSCTPQSWVMLHYS